MSDFFIICKMNVLYVRPTFTLNRELAQVSLGFSTNTFMLIEIVQRENIIVLPCYSWPGLSSEQGTAFQVANPALDSL